MSSILALLSGGLAPLIAGAFSIIAVLLALLGIRRSGIKAGKALAQSQGEQHVQKSAQQSQEVRDAASRLPGDDARQRLRDKWSRP